MKFAVLLAGCGNRDGAEIHESVCTLLAIHQAGGTYQIFAPDKSQRKVTNHLTGEDAPETRNVLVEAARIARGKIRPLTEYRSADFDALVIPGGFGAALNLSTFAIDGPAMEVDPQVEAAIRATADGGKPVGALCVAPAILAKLFPGARLTLGNEPGPAESARAMGADHVDASHGEVVADRERRLFSTPCYMLDATIGDIYQGATHLIRAMMA